MLFLDAQSSGFRSFVGCVEGFGLPIHLEAKSAAFRLLALRDRLRNGFRLRRGRHGYGLGTWSWRRCHCMTSSGRCHSKSCSGRRCSFVSEQKMGLPSLNPSAQNLGGPARRGGASRRLGIGIKPSRCACFLAALRARRTASAFSRVLRSDGFSYALRRFISRKTPSRCIFFLSTLSP